MVPTDDNAQFPVKIKWKKGKGKWDVNNVSRITRHVPPVRWPKDETREEDLEGSQVSSGASEVESTRYQ